MRIRRTAIVFAVLILCVTALVSATGTSADAKKGCNDKVKVNRLSDVEGGKNQLREAITDVCDGGLIKILAGTIILERGELLIPADKTVTIVGLPARGHSSGPGVTIDADQSGRIFRVRDGADLTVDSLTLTGAYGYTGGAIDNLRGAVTVIDCRIEHNFATKAGAGIRVSYGSVSIFNSVIGGNSGGYGAVIWSIGSTVSIDGTWIVGNSVRTDGGGILVRGGSLFVTNSVIEYNTAEEDGGGIWFADAFVVVTQSRISDNSATGNGGGIWYSGSPPNLAGTSFFGNTPDDIYPTIP